MRGKYHIRNRSRERFSIAMIEDAIRQIEAEPRSKRRDARLASWRTERSRMLHRSTDPQTSVEAAEKVVPKVASDTARIYSVLVEHGPLTASEIDFEVKTYTRESSPAHKRCADLLRQKLIEKGDVRVCSVTGYRATTWRVR